MIPITVEMFLKILFIVKTVKLFSGEKIGPRHLQFLKVLRFAYQGFLSAMSVYKCMIPKSEFSCQHVCFSYL